MDRLGTTKVNEGLPLANMVHQTLYTNISHVKYENIQYKCSDSIGINLISIRLFNQPKVMFLWMCLN